VLGIRERRASCPSEGDYENDPDATSDPLHSAATHSRRDCWQGSAAQRNAALSTLSVDHTIRSLRMARSMAAGLPRTGPALQSPGAIANPKPHRSIFTAKHEESLPGTLVRAEGASASGDAAVDEAYDGLGATFDFYWAVFRAELD